MDISEETRRKVLVFQRNEITEHHIYRKLAKWIKDPENRRVLEKISREELEHYHTWRSYTDQDVKPDWNKVWLYYWISRILGFTFGVKLMEGGEQGAQDSYDELRAEIAEAETIMNEEDQHEAALIEMLDEERLQYTGSMVLGLNDALVELTGVLAGLTLALQNTRLIALTGLITGIAAALSMAASEYLSTKAEETTKNPLRASIYTGVAYLITVFFLILPYLLLDNYYLCLGCTLAGAVLIIALFNYYISVAKDESFRKRFIEMAGLSLSVAAFSFLIGYLLRSFLGIDI